MSRASNSDEFNSDLEISFSNPVSISIPRKIASESWPFLLNRLIELVVDYGAMAMLSQVDTDRRDATSLITSMCIILRSVNATFLFYTGKEVNGNKNNPLEVGNILRNSWLFALPLGITAAGIALSSEYILKGLGQPGRAAEVAKNFLWPYAAGLPFTLMTISNQQTMLGLNKPKYVLMMTALNVPLILAIGYPFIFNLGLNETGLGFAYAISGFSHYISYLILFKCKFNEYKIFNLGSLFIKDGKCILLASKGFWIGLYAFIELGNVLANTILVGRSDNAGGDDALSALQPALQYASMVANLTFALGHTLTILITGSQKNKIYSETKKLGTYGLLMGLTFPLTILGVFFINQDFLLKPFLGEDTNDLARHLLLINILGQVADTFRNIGSGILRGMGNTSFPSNVNMATVLCLMMPFSFITEMIYNLGPEAILSGRAVGIAVGGALISYKCIREDRALPGDGYDYLPEQPASEDKGCWRKCRDRLFGQKKKDNIQDQPQSGLPLQSWRSGCIIL